jgi:hypothetical protein
MRKQNMPKKAAGKTGGKGKSSAVESKKKRKLPEAFARRNAMVKKLKAENPAFNPFTKEGQAEVTKRLEAEK